MKYVLHCSAGIACEPWKNWIRGVVEVLTVSDSLHFTDTIGN